MNVGRVNANAVNGKVVIDQFLDWANRTFPGSKARIVAKVEAKRNTRLGQVPGFAPMAFPGQSIPALPMAQPAQEEESWFQDIVGDVIGAAKEILPAYTQYQSQKTIADAQLERMRRGLPPADPQIYQAPPVVVRHEVRPDIGPISKETQNMLMWGAALIGGILLFASRGRN